MTRTPVAIPIKSPFRSGRAAAAPGFTIIELMITLVIAGILLAIGIPSMRDMIKQNRLTGHVNEFVAANMLARSEAIKQGRAVKLCRTLDANATPPTCATAGDWNAGWLVVTTEMPSVLLARQQALPAGTTITPSPASASITYTGMGQPTAAASFTFDNDCKLTRRKVEIESAGRTSVTTIDAALAC